MLHRALYFILFTFVVSPSCFSMVLRSQVDKDLQRVPELQGLQCAEQLLGAGTYGLVLDCKEGEKSWAVKVTEIFYESQSQEDDDDRISPENLREKFTLERTRGAQHLISSYKTVLGRNYYYHWLEKCSENLLQLRVRSKDFKDESRATWIQKFTGDLVVGYRELRSLNLVHRDIKPMNILFCDGQLKYTDFGASRQWNAQKNSATYISSSPAATNSQNRGTRWYLSPEAALGRSANLERVDLWAIGATVLEMVIGRPAFPGEEQKNAPGETRSAKMLLEQTLKNQASLIYNLLGPPLSWDDDDLLSSIDWKINPWSSDAKRKAVRDVFAFSGIASVDALMTSFLQTEPSRRQWELQQVDFNSSFSKESRRFVRKQDQEKVQVHSSFNPLKLEQSIRVSDQLFGLTEGYENPEVFHLAHGIFWQSVVDVSPSFEKLAQVSVVSAGIAKVLLLRKFSPSLASLSKDLETLNQSFQYQSSHLVMNQSLREEIVRQIQVVSHVYPSVQTPWQLAQKAQLDPALLKDVRLVLELFAMGGPIGGSSPEWLFEAALSIARKMIAAPSNVGSNDVSQCSFTASFLAAAYGERYLDLLKGSMWSLQTSVLDQVRLRNALHECSSGFQRAVPTVLRAIRGTTGSARN